MSDRQRTSFKQRTIALVYDFDGTLCPRAMQEYGVLPKINVPPQEFWRQVKAESKAEGAEEILTYMRLMIEKADNAKKRVNREDFTDFGRKIEFFAGVEGWFDRINAYARERAGTSRISLRHYVVSAGLLEIIEGSSIFKKFHKVFASTYHYDPYGHPIWPNRVVTDTSKTQYLFRINKGAEELSINSHMSPWVRPIPFKNMIYFGDGETDVPSFTVTRQQGGSAIAVYPPNSRAGRSKCEELWEVGRVDFFALLISAKGRIWILRQRGFSTGSSLTSAYTSLR